eukprot:6460493-Amphidinium_carterae.1
MRNSKSGILRKGNRRTTGILQGYFRNIEAILKDCEPIEYSMNNTRALKECSSTTYNADILLYMRS